jgi:hypothetical protein
VGDFQVATGGGFWVATRDERDFVIFISQNLKNRLGDMSIYDFEFLKTFMEAKQDYHAKKVLDAIMGVESCSN